MTETKEFELPIYGETITIPLELDGYTIELPFRCVDETSEGVVMLADKLLFLGLPFDKEGCNVWAVSDINRWLNSTFLDALPAETSRHIVKHEATLKKVFLPSVRELKGWLGKDGLACKLLGSEKAYYYWTRDAKASDSYSVRRVDTDGTLGSSYARYGCLALRPAFVIGDPESCYQDSQEQINDDATYAPAAYCARYLNMDGWHGGYDDAELREAMITDLLRRQRELDGATDGEE